MNTQLPMLSVLMILKKAISINDNTDLKLFQLDWIMISQIEFPYSFLKKYQRFIKWEVYSKLHKIPRRMLKTLINYKEPICLRAQELFYSKSESDRKWFEEFYDKIFREIVTRKEK